MKKIVDVSFKSKKELAQALIDGRIFITPMGRKLYFLEQSESSPFRYSAGGSVSDSMSGVWGDYAKLQEEVEVMWYNAIPKQGVICWVWNTGKQKDATLKVVHGYSPHERAPYLIESGVGYLYAIPVKAEELCEGE
jgi:hypothetical protein